MIRFVFTLALAAPLAGCATVPQAAALHPEAMPYSEGRDAMADVDAALARAKQRNTRLLLVMGANWCHDSRALAGWLASPRFQDMVTEHYEMVFVDAGKPQEKQGRNLDVARRFGIDELPGTPNLFVIRSDGTLMNGESVTGWRNAASRSEDAIYNELLALASG